MGPSRPIPCGSSNARFLCSERNVNQLTKAKLTSTDNVNDMAELVTASKFAIAAGCSRQAVSKAIQQGRLEGALVDTGNVNPKIDLERGLRIWGVTERPSAAQMPEKPKKSRPLLSELRFCAIRQEIFLSLNVSVASF